MKAALIHRFEGIEKIEIEEVSIPLPESSEVQVAIKCAGVNPVDWKIAEGMLKTRMDYQFPITLGWEMSGIVSAVGEDVKTLQVGEAVFAYCRKEIIHDGTFAEYICLDAENVLPKPQSLSFAEAASIPLCSLTAWQSLFEGARLQPNETILIHGGSGGVGGFAIQFAKLQGAHVITTARAANRDYVGLLGADEVIDYQKENFLDILRQKHPDGVDVIYDTVGGQTLTDSYDAVKVGGRLVTIAGVIDQEIASRRQLKTSFIFVHPDRKQLQHISELIEAEKVSPPRIQELPFENVEEALRRSRIGHTQGKLVLNLE